MEDELIVSTRCGFTAMAGSGNFLFISFFDFGKFLLEYFFGFV